MDFLRAVVADVLRRVAEELEGLVARGARYVFITDSVFNTTKEHAAQVCEAILSRGVKVPWCCFLRPGVVALAWTDDEQDPQYPISLDAWQRLRAFRDALGDGARLAVDVVGPAVGPQERDQAGVDATVTGREKHLYSIYRKMIRKNRSLSEIADVFAFRLVMKEVDSCYRALGIVQIDDDVEIGACSTIDRARFGCTHIGEGTKIDNLVHIGHNARVGRLCLLVAQCGVSGSSRLEDGVVFVVMEL